MSAKPELKRDVKGLFRLSELFQLSLGTRTSNEVRYLFFLRSLSQFVPYLKPVSWMTIDKSTSDNKVYFIKKGICNAVTVPCLRVKTLIRLNVFLLKFNVIVKLGRILREVRMRSDRFAADELLLAEWWIQRRKSKNKPSLRKKITSTRDNTS
jgi:hypothetical protein